MNEESVDQINERLHTTLDVFRLVLNEMRSFMILFRDLHCPPSVSVGLKERIDRALAFERAEKCRLRMGGEPSGTRRPYDILRMDRVFFAEALEVEENRRGGA